MANRTYYCKNPNEPDVDMMFAIRDRRDMFGNMLSTLGKKLAVQQNVTAETMHSVIYLAFLATKFGDLDPEEALSDSGIVHRVSHWLIGNPFVADTLEQLCNDLDELQAKVEKHFEYGVDV